MQKFDIVEATEKWISLEKKRDRNDSYESDFS